MLLELQKDKEGNIITLPMTGWGITDVAGMSLILTIQYVETPEQLETGERKQMQTIVTVQKALELAEALRRAASGLLGPLANGAPLQ
jgi:hypothetical protein